LFKLLTVLSSVSNLERLTEIKKQLTLLDWFDDFELASNSPLGQKNINIRDKFLDENLAYFTQKSANEGFLFLLFYFTLFISQETPSFFAIDNVDASLNPKLCSRLVKDLAVLSKKHDKQAILTTHNPAILDGLDLNDEEQRLYVVYRNKLGQTKVKRIQKSEPVEGQPPVRLSEAFLRGYLGGLPRNF
jgi:predicted ATPase